MAREHAAEGLGFVRPVLKVTVLGNSTAVWVAPERTSRGDGTYGEHLESVLAQRGLPCQVTNLARWNELLPKALCRFDAAVRSDTPDVVVLHYGAAEAFPGVLPLRVHDYLHTWHVHAGFGRTRARNALRKLLWKRLRTWQTQAARVVGPRTHHVGPERFRAELTQVLRNVHRDQRALTVVMGIPRPTTELCAAVPGIAERFARFNDVMRQTCEAAAPGSAYFVDLLDLDDAPEVVPDGLHVSAQAHAVLGLRLADVIEGWVAQHSGARYARATDT